MAIKGVTSAVIKLDNRLTVWLSKIGDPEICLTFGPLNSTTQFLSSSRVLKYATHDRVNKTPN